MHGNCSNASELYITKCKELVQICVSYVIMKRKRLPARKDNNSMAHLQININN